MALNYFINYTVPIGEVTDIQRFFDSPLYQSRGFSETTWTNKLLTLEFDSTGTNYSDVQQAISEYFDPPTFSRPLLCSYPISGQYGFLPRLSYYLLLILALVLRRHTWLSTAALGAAMTYAATTCVHAFALLARYSYNNLEEIHLLEKKDPRYYGDVDIVPMMQILATASIMLAPMLTWSNVIKKHEARSIVVLWSLLIFTGLIPVAVVNWQGVLPFYVDNQLATCVEDLRNGCTYDALFGDSASLHQRLSNRDSSDLYKKCQCHDSCGVIANLESPFRRDASVQAFLVSDHVNHMLGSNTFWWFYLVNILALIVVGGQGVLGLILIKWSQSDLRKLIFRRIAGSTPKSGRKEAGARLSYHVGRLVAAFVYMLLLVIAIVICPLVFVGTLVVNEIITFGYPTSEGYSAVGQWAPLVSTLFVLVAAVLQKFHRPWKRSLMHFIRRKSQSAKNLTLADEENCTKDDSTINRGSSGILQILKRSNAWHEWKNFLRWWKDPPFNSAKVDLFSLRQDYIKLSDEAQNLKEALRLYVEARDTFDNAIKALPVKEMEDSFIKEHKIIVQTFLEKLAVDGNSVGIVQSRDHGNALEPGSPEKPPVLIQKGQQTDELSLTSHMKPTTARQRSSKSLPNLPPQATEEV